MSQNKRSQKPASRLKSGLALAGAQDQDSKTANELPRKTSSRTGNFARKNSESVNKTSESERSADLKKQSQNSNRSNSQSKFPKFKDNQSKQTDKKSRNSNVRPINPNDQGDMFFNSNREKSPIPD